MKVEEISIPEEQFLAQIKLNIDRLTLVNLNIILLCSSRELPEEKEDCCAALEFREERRIDIVHLKLAFRSELSLGVQSVESLRDKCLIVNKHLPRNPSEFTSRLGETWTLWQVYFAPRRLSSFGLLQALSLESSP